MSGVAGLQCEPRYSSTFLWLPCWSRSRRVHQTREPSQQHLLTPQPQASGNHRLCGGQRAGSRFQCNLTVPVPWLGNTVAGLEACASPSGVHGSVFCPTEISEGELRYRIPRHCLENHERVHCRAVKSNHPGLIIPSSKWS